MAVKKTKKDKTEVDPIEKIREKIKIQKGALTKIIKQTQKDNKDT